VPRESFFFPVEGRVPFALTFLHHVLSFQFFPRFFLVPLMSALRGPVSWLSFLSLFRALLQFIFPFESLLSDPDPYVFLDAFSLPSSCPLFCFAAFPFLIFPFRLELQQAVRFALFPCPCLPSFFFVSQSAALFLLRSPRFLYSGLGTFPQSFLCSFTRRVLLLFTFVLSFFLASSVLFFFCSC